MVKGISRQVIVVNAPEPKLFDQAIFILKDQPGGEVTEEALLKEAKGLLRSHGGRARSGIWGSGPLWACGGAAATGLVWLLTSLL